MTLIAASAGWNPGVVPLAQARGAPPGGMRARSFYRLGGRPGLIDRWIGNSLRIQRLNYAVHEHPLPVAAGVVGVALLGGLAGFGVTTLLGGSSLLGLTIGMAMAIGIGVIGAVWPLNWCITDAALKIGSPTALVHRFESLLDPHETNDVLIRAHTTRTNQFAFWFAFRYLEVGDQRGFRTLFRLASREAMRDESFREWVSLVDNIVRNLEGSPLHSRIPWLLEEKVGFLLHLAELHQTAMTFEECRRMQGNSPLTADQIYLAEKIYSALGESNFFSRAEAFLVKIGLPFHRIMALEDYAASLRENGETAMAEAVEQRISGLYQASGGQQAMLAFLFEQGETSLEAFHIGSLADLLNIAIRSQEYLAKALKVARRLNDTEGRLRDR